MCPRVGTDRTDLRHSHPRRENASITTGTTSDNYFQFAAATVENGEEGLDEPWTGPIRRENTSATLPGRTMRSGDVDQPRLRRVVDLLIRDGGIGIRSEWFQVFGTRFFDESDLSKVGLGQSRPFLA